MVDAYGSFLHFSSRMRWLMALLFLLIIAGSILNVGTNMRLVLFPPEGIDKFRVQAKAPMGTSLEQTRQLMKPVEDLVANLRDEELINFVTTIGELRQREDEPGERGSHYGQVMVYLTPEPARERSATEIIEALRNQVASIESLEITFGRINPGPPVGSPINVGVQGQNYAEIMQLVDEIVADLKAMPGTKDIDHNFSPGKEQTVVQVKSEEAQSVGLSVAAVGQTVLAAFEGLIATSIRELDDEIDIRVSLPESEKRGKDGFGQLSILNSRGQLIRLDTVASFETEKGIQSYSHENNRRQVTITGDVNIDVTSATEVSNAIRAKEKEYLAKYPNLALNFGGEDQDTQESLDSLKSAFILALILIYFLLILTFQSFVWPIIIIMVIPIGAVSVTWALFLHNEPLSFMGMLGVVALAGVIVHNAIVFVDFVMSERAEGASNRRSIIEAGKKRLRPIVLTTLTTVSGILPTAYGIGGLDPFVVPIALALGWGMLIGSFLSSLFLPAFVSILDDIQYINRKIPEFLQKVSGRQA
jgi:multidrug efflux pump subunit AcrB